MERTVVLYPGLAVSHFAPMMRLIEPLLGAGYAVAVALIDVPPDQNPALAAAVRRAVASYASNPAVAFHKLPRVPDPDPPAVTGDWLLGYLDLVRRYNGGLRDLLLRLSRGATGGGVRAVVVDSLSNAALEVARDAGLPGYVFFGSNASALAVFLQLPSLRLSSDGRPVRFKDLGDSPLHFHGVPPLPASHLMGELLEDPESETYRATMGSLSKNLDADGVLVNTFVALEARVVAALKNPTSELKIPPIYCVGPLVGDGDEEEEARDEEAKEKHRCLAWLDAQPARSVVFLCFGSAGCHAAAQLAEIAKGLERSGHRFLWAARAAAAGAPEHGAVEALLPEGFTERTRGRGLVVGGWAPQAAVLAHAATGAFVTHCGWNSALEALAAGTPMLCWPMYAEQRMNRALVVGRLGASVEVAGWEKDLVEAGEVEAKVRLVMEAGEGERLRARAGELAEAAAVAWVDGGPSRAEFARFVADVERRRSSQLAASRSD